MDNVILSRLAAIEAKLDQLSLQHETVLTMSEAAALMGLCNDKFRRIHAELLPSYRVGRRIVFKKSDVLRALERFQRVDVQTGAQRTIARLKKGGV